jgi:type IV secretory pathway VirB4 component
MKTYEGYEKPSFNKFLNTLKEEALIDPQINFVDDILQLSEGSLGGLFNNYNKIDLNADIICFDLSNLNTDDKKIPATYLLGNIINKLIEKGDRRRMIYIDEAHKLLINEATTAFYVDLVKTARKRKAGVVSITQNPEDFKESNNSKTIITQAETTILLKQATASINYINRFNLFQLTDRECTDLSSFAIGEALFIREREHIYVDIFPFASEKPLVFTS